MVPTGGVDPLTGRSFYQIAMASRSLHRSQDMGGLQEPGQEGRPWAGSTAGRGEGKELFAGVDTRLGAMAAEVPTRPAGTEMEKRLGAWSGLVADAPPALAAGARDRADAGRARRAARRARAREARRRRRRDAARREDRARAGGAGRGRGRHDRRSRGPRGRRARRIVRGHGLRVERRGRAGLRHGRALKGRREAGARPGAPAPGRSSREARGVEVERALPADARPDPPLLSPSAAPGALYDWTETRRRARRAVPAGASDGGREPDDRRAGP